MQTSAGPSFEKFFGFVPCFINSRLATRGIPISCESDIYGALSEYVCSCATEMPAAILDINNTVPADMYAEAGTGVNGYGNHELFMGFHCGNTSSTCMASPIIKYQLIMHRLMEPGKEPDITRGTLEGTIRPGEYHALPAPGDRRKPGSRAYVARRGDPEHRSEILRLHCRLCRREMESFYRHVLIGKRFPHHTAVAFAHSGRALFDAMNLIGVGDISFNQPKGLLYPTEHPFA